ncbi:hypothetical protein GCM10010095_12440 [Streptomyces anthocyanicus]|nr:hypothetical protein GCM10010095_12440 [Streptomyces anthocyanicus]GHA47180.1 hypothetical protein GCM10010391_34590 [Streptomyces anthocyanicus]
MSEGASVTLVLEWEGEWLRVEVHDKSRSVPSLSVADCDDACGRGLHLLAAVAADWGTVLILVGESVWSETALGAEQPCRRMERAVAALESYRTLDRMAQAGRLHGTALRTSAVELIADLLPGTATSGLGPEDILERVQMFYEAEESAAT